MGTPRPAGGYLPRVVDAKLRASLDALGAVLIEGVKACGKTTTARRAARSEVLLDAEPEAARKVDLDPRLLLDGRAPRLLDEWQLAPPLWNAVRRAVDDRQTAGQFILTGSAIPQHDPRRHSGTGRFGAIAMRTMTLSEQQAGVPAVSVAGLLEGAGPTPTNCPLCARDYLRHAAIGGWPALVGRDERAARAYLTGYLRSVVENDISEVSGAPRDPRLVRRVLHAYARQLAQPATLAAIVKGAGASTAADAPSRHTAQTYLDALRLMMIIDEVPAWTPLVRSSKRLITTAKRHFADPSLAVALLRLTPDRMLDDLRIADRLFDSLAAHDLRVHADAAGAFIYHYREADGRLAADYLLETHDGELVGVQVRLGEGEIDAAADSLRRLAARLPRKPRALVVITATSLAHTRPDGVHVVPLGLLGP